MRNNGVVITFNHPSLSDKRMLTFPRMVYIMDFCFRSSDSLVKNGNYQSSVNVQ